MKNKNRHLVKNVIGTLTIPVLVAVLLQGICMFNGKTMISNMTGFDNFVVYIAIVMITTIALSINLNSGRFDFSLGSMAALSSVLGGLLKKDEIENAIAIPTEAIVPEMGKDKVYLYKSGKAEPVDIITGIRTASEVQVIRGLHMGDTIITSGTLQLRTGLAVTLDKID